jgi:hypothetical protein
LCSNERFAFAAVYPAKSNQTAHVIILRLTNTA